MRIATTLIILLCAGATASAQRPWGEYSVAQQERIVASHAVPDVVRESYNDLDELSYSERCDLLDIVTTPTRNKRLASLYIDIYERLRSADGSDGAQDAEMLMHYPRYMLNSWSEEEGDFQLYNYAYAIAAHFAHEGSVESLQNTLRHIRRRAASRSRSKVALFAAAASSIYTSEVLGLSLYVDHTPIATSEQLPREISADRYHAALAKHPSIARPAIEADDTATLMAYEETTTWGSYYTALPIAEDLASQGMTLVYRQGALGADIIVRDSDDVCHTLPRNLYILPTGTLYGIYTDEASSVERVIVGHIDAGRLRLEGAIAIEHGELCGAKCNDEGLLLHIGHGNEERYYIISATER